MADTIPKPRHLTRSSLIGHAFRIQKTYGISALGVRVMCAWHRAVGNRSILEMVLPRTVDMAPFENVHGERVVMSRKRIARLRRKLAEVRLLVEAAGGMSAGMTFVAKFSKSTAKTLAISIHAPGCSCVSGNNNAKTGYKWGLEAATLADAVAEVKTSEDADGRGIKVKVAASAQVRP